MLKERGFGLSAGSNKSYALALITHAEALGPLDVFLFFTAMAISALPFQGSRSPSFDAIDECVLIWSVNGNLSFYL